MTAYWPKVIEAAKVRKKKGLEPFTHEQQDRAMDWVTCACGKQDDRIPRSEIIQPWPLDPRLRDLGSKFAWAVEDGKPEKAQSILGKIERRAAQVLAKVLKEKQ
jgi:hypothetical protein